MRGPLVALALWVAVEPGMASKAFQATATTTRRGLSRPRSFFFPISPKTLDVSVASDHNPRDWEPDEGWDLGDGYLEAKVGGQDPPEVRALASLTFPFLTTHPTL